MTVLFEMRIRVGGDPRGSAEFGALRDELAKLNHPACPDVDWARVEQLCLTLFQQNGGDLQTAASFALARSHRYGLEGMAQGASLIEALACEWSTLWPPVPSVRLDILAWLFAQLQWLLRSLEIDGRSLPALLQLGTELQRLRQRLDHQAHAPMVALQALRQQIEALIIRLQGHPVSGVMTPLPTRGSSPAVLMPVVVVPATPMPEMKSSKRRLVICLCAGAASILLASGLWWQTSGANKEGSPGLISLFKPEQTVPTPVRLNSLSLFKAGSAEFNPDSTKVLISALVDIKAQPGWLIVITGHSDAKGSAENNLQLSHARASAVRGWMQTMSDIPDSCFAVQGLAASQPIASNDTEPGRAANRRVDISLVPQVGACGQAVEPGFNAMSSG